MGLLKKLFGNSKEHTTSKKIIPRESRDLIFSLRIPEPTRSLLFVTDENPIKYISPSTYTININITSHGVETSSNDHGTLFSEPSLIWTKLKIEPNEKLESEALYYPVFHDLTPKQRYQYLKWLTDITHPTNLSYVFLYYYGLERHLILGDYDRAVDEIVKLIKYHDKGSFKHYATTALITASLYRNRGDIFERIPFLKTDISNEALLLRAISGIQLPAKDIVNLTNKVKFYNKRYIKSYPELFEKELQKILEKYEKENGKIMQTIQYDKLEKRDSILFANLAIPKRTSNIPQLLDNEDFKKTLYSLLSEAHKKVKEIKKNEK
jgi:hypothetical protein